MQIRVLVVVFLAVVSLTNTLAQKSEFLFYGGGTETDDLGYNNLGFLVNARGEYPFNQNKTNSPYIFGTGGIGYGRVADTGDVADARDNLGIDTSDSGFAFQFKAGVGYPLKDNLILSDSFVTSIYL